MSVVHDEDGTQEARLVPAANDRHENVARRSRDADGCEGGCQRQVAPDTVAERSAVLAQYNALMVIETLYGRDMARRFLWNTRVEYLKQRTATFRSTGFAAAGGESPWVVTGTPARAGVDPRLLLTGCNWSDNV